MQSNLLKSLFFFPDLSNDIKTRKKGMQLRNRLLSYPGKLTGNHLIKIIKIICFKLK